VHLSLSLLSLSPISRLHTSVCLSLPIIPDAYPARSRSRSTTSTRCWKAWA
jgi:hypothetical protein